MSITGICSGKTFWLVVVVVGTVRVVLRKMKDKQKLTDLAMYATVEAEKQKWEKEEKSANPSTVRQAHCRQARGRQLTADFLWNLESGIWNRLYVLP